MAHAGDEIFNPRTGQRMVFRQVAADTEGKLLQTETINPPGPAEPVHVHPIQESSAEMLSGTLHFQVAGETRVIHAGEKLVIPANTPHSFWNKGPEDAHAIQELRPAMRSEEFFETWFAMVHNGLLKENGLPSLLHLAILVPVFANEMRPVSPPWPVIQAMSWLFGPIARARGYGSILTSSNAAVPSRIA